MVVHYLSLHSVVVALARQQPDSSRTSTVGEHGMASVTGTNGGVTPTKANRR